MAEAVRVSSGGRVAEAIRVPADTRSSNSSSNPVTSEQADQTYKGIKSSHDKAHTDVKLALNFDEKGVMDKAIDFYQRALKAIAKGLSFDCSGTGSIGEQWDQARNLQEKMRKTARQIKSRLEALEKQFVQSPQPTRTDQRSSEVGDIGAVGNQRSSEASDMGAVGGCAVNGHGAMPPPYSIHPAARGWNGAEAMDLSMNMALESELDELGEPPSYAETMEDAYEVYGIEEGVQLYFISSSGLVSAPSTPSSLKVYKFFDEDKVRERGQPPAFLQVGEWLYPLVPGQSPVLRSTGGAYIFPDTQSSDPGACVGVVVPSNLSSAKQRNFQETIQEMTSLREERAEPPSEAARTIPAAPSERATEDRSGEQGYTTTIAKGIETGASWLSWGLEKGAVVGGQLLSKGADKLKRHIRPVEDPKEFDEKYQKGAHYARKVTGGVVTVSGVVVDGLCYMTTKLGEVAAPVLKEQTDKLIKKGDKGEENGKWSKVASGTAEVAGSALIGFGVIYSGLEQAAKSLAKSIHNSTVNVVQHRYGDDAGKLTDNSMASVGNVGLSVYNFKHLGVKAVAKRAAKDTGKALVGEYDKKPEASNGDLNPT